MEDVLGGDEVVDLRRDLFPGFVAALCFGGSLPVEVCPGRSAAFVAPYAQDLIAIGELSRFDVVAPVEESSFVSELRARFSSCFRTAAGSPTTALSSTSSIQNGLENLLSVYERRQSRIRVVRLELLHRIVSARHAD